MLKNTIKKLFGIIAAVLLFSGCSGTNESRVNVISVDNGKVIDLPKSTSIQSSVRPTESIISSDSGTVEYENSSQSSSPETSKVSVSSSISSIAPIVASSDETSKREPENDNSIRYVTRQKYGKKEPYPDAERSRFYNVMQMVRVVSKTDTGYYLLDNGDYIFGDYLSETDDISNLIPERVAGTIPDSPPENTSKHSDYDPRAALQYAKSHWNKDMCFCAEFGSECLTAGGAMFDLASSTNLYNSLVKSNLGYAVEIDLNEDGKANLPEYVYPGDVIFYYCAAENMMVHTAIYNGDTKDGLMKAYAHNPNDNGENAFFYRETCTGGCNCPLKKVVVFCFFRNPDEMKAPTVVPKLSADVNGKYVKFNWDTDFVYRSSEIVIVDKDGKEVFRSSTGTDKEYEVVFALYGEFTTRVEFKILNNITLRSTDVNYSIDTGEQSVPINSNETSHNSSE